MNHLCAGLPTGAVVGIFSRHPQNAAFNKPLHTEPWAARLPKSISFAAARRKGPLAGSEGELSEMEKLLRGAKATKKGRARWRWPGDEDGTR